MRLEYVRRLTEYPIKSVTLDARYWSMMSDEARVAMRLKGAVWVQTRTHCNLILSNKKRFLSMRNLTKQHTTNRNYHTIISSPRPASFSAALRTVSSDRTGKLLVDELRGRVAKGEVIEDAAQGRVAERLSRLQRVLRSYIPKVVGVQGNTSSLSSLPIAVPRGLYIHGEVGTGKSMIMDLFFEITSQEFPRVCRRVHFHTFMSDIHSRIHALKKEDLEKFGRNFHVDTSKERNPVIRVADALSREVKVLCFDEFQVTDVADALVLSQLFSILFSNGVVCIATSNRPPESLYEGGINRSYFLPFINLLEKHCIIHSMSNSNDYRLMLADGCENFFFVGENSNETVDKCEEMFYYILGDSHPVETVLPVAFGRNIYVKRSDSKKMVCIFHFQELCEVELGASDYHAIAEQYRIVIIEDIPILTLKQHDQARRFITLVDELYEARCALFCCASARPGELFDVQNDTNSRHMVDMELKPGEILGVDVAQTTGKTIGELASVRELRFAFKRAASRLVEMTSKSWWVKHAGVEF